MASKKKHIAQAVAARLSGPNIKYPVGTRVKHIHFGWGVVTKSHFHYCTIEWDESAHISTMGMGFMKEYAVSKTKYKKLRRLKKRGII